MLGGRIAAAAKAGEESPDSTGRDAPFTWGRPE